VHTCHAHAADVASHEGTQVIGAGDAENAPFAGGDVFGIVGRDGYGIDHQAAVLGKIALVVVVADGDAVGLQLIRHRGTGAVGAGGGMAGSESEQGQGGHHNAADSNEENGRARVQAVLQTGVDAQCAFVGVRCRHRVLLFIRVISDERRM